MVRLTIPEPMLSDIPDPVARYISSATEIGATVTWHGITFYKYRDSLIALVSGREVVIGKFIGGAK